MDAETKTISTYCPYCDREVVASLSSSTRTLSVKGQPAEFRSTDAVCPECGQVIGDSRVEDDNLRRAYDAYRRNNGPLPVEERIGMGSPCASSLGSSGSAIRR